MTVVMFSGGYPCLQYTYIYKHICVLHITVVYVVI